MGWWDVYIHWLYKSYRNLYDILAIRRCFMAAGHPSLDIKSQHSTIPVIREAHVSISQCKTRFGSVRTNIDGCPTIWEKFGLPIWSSWWFQPIWKILVTMGIFPNFRGEKTKYLSCHRPYDGVPKLNLPKKKSTPSKRRQKSSQPKSSTSASPWSAPDGIRDDQISVGGQRRPSPRACRCSAKTYLTDGWFPKIVGTPTPKSSIKK